MIEVDNESLHLHQIHFSLCVFQLRVVYLCMIIDNKLNVLESKAVSHCFLSFVLIALCVFELRVMYLCIFLNPKLYFGLFPLFPNCLLYNCVRSNQFEAKLPNMLQSVQTYCGSPIPVSSFLFVIASCAFVSFSTAYH